VINIAIDGYSSCGKSTLAKQLAQELHYTYIDTGAMYRAVALYVTRNNIHIENNPDLSALINALNDIVIDFRNNTQSNKREVYLNGESVESFIRDPKIAAIASQISQIRQVRDKLQQWQKKIAQKKGVVMDGRDIATVVMPDAELKIFMTANAEIRAMRRYNELLGAGKNITLEEVKQEQALRDYQDTHRTEDPLVQHPKARILDNSLLTTEAQLALAMKWVQEVMQVST